MSEKKSGWSTGITILISGFVIFMLALVGFSSFQSFHLVETDYYQKDKQGWKKAGWDKEKTKKRGEGVSTKYTQKRPGQKIDKWEE